VRSKIGQGSCPTISAIDILIHHIGIIVIRESYMLLHYPWAIPPDEF
jgi:hypothetical protein